MKTQNEANMKFMDVEKKRNLLREVFSERDKGNAGVGRYPPATGDHPDLPGAPTFNITTYTADSTEAFRR